jgi:hypothetical protein
MSIYGDVKNEIGKKYFHFENGRRRLILSSFLTFILLNSCSREADFTGIYETDKYSLAEKASKNIFTKTGFVVGSKLELKDDSTFLYQTCGNRMEGHWHILNDSLILDVDSNLWRSDSLQEVGLFGRMPGADFDLTFQINGDCLVQVKRPNDGQGAYFLRLKKGK